MSNISVFGARASLSSGMLYLDEEEAAENEESPDYEAMGPTGTILMYREPRLSARDRITLISSLHSSTLSQCRSTPLEGSALLILKSPCAWCFQCDHDLIHNFFGIIYALPMFIKSKDAGMYWAMRTLRIRLSSVKYLCPEESLSTVIETTCALRSSSGPDQSDLIVGKGESVIGVSGLLNTPVA